jgi:hypothetical protein
MTKLVSGRLNQGSVPGNGVSVIFLSRNLCECGLELCLLLTCDSPGVA